MRRKLLSTLLALAMVLSLLPASALAVEALTVINPEAPISANNSAKFYNALFAEGKDVVVEPAVEGDGLLVTVGEQQYTFANNTTDYGNGAETDGLTIFAGYNNDANDTTGTSTITVKNGANVGAIFAGGYNNSKCGTVNVVVEEGAKVGTIYGGGLTQYGDKTSKASTQNSKITVNGWVGILYAGGAAATGVTFDEVISITDKTANNYVNNSSVTIGSTGIVRYYFGGSFSYGYVENVNCTVSGQMSPLSADYSGVSGTNGYRGTASMTVEEGGSVGQLYCSMRGYLAGDTTLTNKGTISLLMLAPDGNEVVSLGSTIVTNTGTIKDCRFDCGCAKRTITGCTASQDKPSIPALIVVDGDVTVSNVKVNESNYADTSVTATVTIPETTTLVLKNGATYTGSDTERVAVAQVGKTYYPTLAAAIGAAEKGATVDLLTDVTVDSKLLINKTITLNGNGNTVTAAESWSGKANDTKHLLGIEGADASGTIINNITFDSNNKAYGVQPFDAVSVTFNDVTIQNTVGTGLNVKGTALSANDLTISGSSWGQSIDVSKGSANSSASLTLTGEINLNDLIDIFEDLDTADGKPTATGVKVNDKAYTWQAVNVGTEDSPKYKAIYYPEYTITLKYQDGTTADTEIKTGLDGNLTEALPTPAWEGYEFNGWFTDATGGTAFDAYNITADTTIYAKWTENATEPEEPGDEETAYTITLDPKNGGNTTTVMTDANGKLTDTQLYTPTWTNHTFNGWYTQESGGTQVTNAYVFAADATIYGQWTALPTGGGSTGGGSSSGGSSSTGSTTTTTNPDGSVTTTVTQPDGTVTETTTDTAGNKTETVTNTDGSAQTTVTNKDGSSSVTTVSQSGQVEAEVTLPAAVVNEAAQSGEAVALPMPAVPVTADQQSAATVTVNLPAGATARVLVPVEDATAGTVALLVNEDGTEEIIKSSVTTENGVAVTLSDGDTVKIVDNSKDFADVADDHWGTDFIDFVTSRELFGGTAEDQFSPEEDMTRAMVWTVLANYDGQKTTAGATWYEQRQQWAMEAGLTDGSDPNGSVTREQLVQTLMNYAALKGVDVSERGDVSAFADGYTTSGWAENAISWAVGVGLLNGRGGGMLEPTGTATRAEVATMLAFFCSNIMQ